MKYAFEWNEFADQPHNVAPRSERARHHFKHWRTYLSLAAADLRYGIPGLRLYRRYRKKMFRERVFLSPDAFAVSVSPPLPPAAEKTGEVVELLKAAGVRETLVRIPSWERDRLDAYEKFARLLHGQGFGLTIALLQRRQDVFEEAAWAKFLEDVVARLSPICPYFEVGHAWNRTKWGVWDYTEYLKLARPAVALREKYGIKLIGPAVIDFEFHLYPPTVSRLPFDKITSLLYVDRVGAPENAQFGWTTAMKVALFKAVADSSAGRECDCWISEVNWPLQGTGPFSPASGTPNVTEEEQADYLVRYYLLCLASGLIERVFWWQLVSPGYGLIDSRQAPWRKRPGYFAFQTMAGIIGGSTYVGKVVPAMSAGGEIFLFEKQGRDFAACWTNGVPFEHEFLRSVERILDRDGKDLAARQRIKIEGSPKYVFFKA
jgi:hypothetical protein